MLQNPRSKRLFSTFATSFFVSLGSLAFASSVQAQVVFQPGFHQALPVSVSTSTRTTYRTRIPIGRGGSRLRISFKAGDGSLTLHSATVALAGTQGKLASAPVAVNFNGSPGFTSNARERVTSDPIADRKSTRLNSSHVAISYAVFCLKKKKIYTEFID